MAFITLAELFGYITETYTAGVIESSQRQRLRMLEAGLEDGPLINERQDPLEDFHKFHPNDAIFQEYDPPPGDDSKMGWKRSRPTKWWMSLWKAMKCVFCIQFIGGLAVGSLTMSIMVLAFNSADLCYDSQSQNWTSLPGKIQAIIVTGESVQAFVVQMWSFLFIVAMFGWPLVKKLNLMSLNLLGALIGTCYLLYLQVYGIYEKSWMPFPENALFLIIVLMNSILVGREIAKNSETDKKRKKTIKVSAILAAQFVLGIPITWGLVYGLIPLYSRQNETYRALIATTFPLIIVIPKIIVRLVGQRNDFLHPGESYVLTSSLYSEYMVVFRVMQADLTSLNLFILLSFMHGSVDLLERLTIVMRDYLWYFIYKKLKQDAAEAEEMLSADKFRTPRSMRFIADMSIQMILGESTALIAAVGFRQMYIFMYSNNSSSFADIHLLADFFIRVTIGLSIDLMFNSFSFWMQMSYLNVAVVRVWKKKWHKHVVVGFILTTLTMCYFTTYLFAIVEDKYSSGGTERHFNCTGPFSRFY
ncbi:hypothetical protein OS493_010496 [Desmophyllum pertusum]|uniref:Uncharacterized protein n=1 Tax=Desmophyllum pertusum TaxID=174260 RepID=A0A9X0A3R5_9CNID|nr:hypothetical protein OS493_010496 [Desmophyllum pertusum]